MSPIPSMIYNAAVGGHVTNSQQIIDEVLNKEQSVLNVEQQELNKGILEEKTYTSGSNNGMGRVVLRKNLVEGVNTLTQSMINKSNTIYVIQYDFTLSENLTVPENCVLEFDGGSLSGNVTITGHNTVIEASITNIFNTNLTFDGTWNVVEVYPEWFGAKGDGITDDTVPFNNTTSFGYNILLTAKTYKTTAQILVNKDNTTISSKCNSVFKISEDWSTSDVFTINANYITIKGITIERNNSNVNYFKSFSISDNKHDIILEQIIFNNMSVCIRLLACNNITVKGCSFIHSSYGVLQEYGYSSNNVTITQCRGENIRNDMIEANCGTAISYNWVISDNICKGSVGYEELTQKTDYDLHQKNEQRFCGLTSIHNATITGNIACNMAREALGCEDMGGKVTVVGNIFGDCYGYGLINIISGNNHASSDVIIDSNQLYNHNANSSTKMIYIWRDGTDQGFVTINNNQFEGHSLLNMPIVIDYPQKTEICNNIFNDFKCLFGKEETDTQLVNESARFQYTLFSNNIVNCKHFIWGKEMLCVNSIVTNNVVVCSDEAILLSAISSGSNLINDVNISNNRITGKITIKNGANLKIKDNTLSVEMDFDVDNYWSGYNIVDDNVIGDGNIQDKTTYSLYNLNIRGNSTNRPSSLKYKGQCYMDITLNKPLYWNGSAYVDATGTTV